MRKKPHDIFFKGEFQGQIDEKENLEYFGTNRLQRVITMAMVKGTSSVMRATLHVHNASGGGGGGGGQD